MERVLKAGDGAAARPRRRISAELWRAGQTAEALLAVAEAEAAAHREAARAEILAWHAEAEARGLEAGRALAAATLLRAEAVRDRALRLADDELVGLAVELARRLVGQALRDQPAAVRGMARAALQAARGRRRAILRLHPASAACLRAEAGELADLAGLPAVEVVGDPALSPGDALVETEAGTVDGRLEVRLADLRRALEGGPA
jgi:flagellar biosynthesis/type III secretory pathway protein FliH